MVARPYKKALRQNRHLIGPKMKFALFGKPKQKLSSKKLKQKIELDRFKKLSKEQSDEIKALKIEIAKLQCQNARINRQIFLRNAPAKPAEKILREDQKKINASFSILL